MSSHVGSFRFESTFFDLPLKSILNLNNRIEELKLTQLFFGKVTNATKKDSIDLFCEVYVTNPTLTEAAVKAIILTVPNVLSQNALIECLKTPYPTEKFIVHDSSLIQLENHDSFFTLFTEILACNDLWIKFAVELNFSAEEVFDISLTPNPAEAFYRRWIVNPLRYPNLVTLEKILTKYNLRDVVQFLRSYGWDSTNAKVKQVAANLPPPKQLEKSSSKTLIIGRPRQ